MFSLFKLWLFFSWFNFFISYFYLSLVHVHYVNYHVVIFMAHLHLNELSLICDMWLNKITYLLTYYCIMTNNWPLLSFLLLHWIAGKYIHSLNPILKILKFKYLQIRHKPCNQLAIKAQSFPRKSPTCSNTASLMTAPLARDFEISRFRDFTWDRECSSNIPHP